MAPLMHEGAPMVPPSLDVARATFWGRSARPVKPTVNRAVQHFFFRLLITPKPSQARRRGPLRRTSFAPPAGGRSLSLLRQAGGKIVVCCALEADLDLSLFVAPA